MKAGLAALTKFVKVVMAYRPDPAKKGKPSPSKPAANSRAPKKSRVHKSGTRG